MKCVVIVLLGLLSLGSSRYFQSDSDPYFYLEGHQETPPFPRYSSPPETRFTCVGRKFGYYADVEAQCQVYHLCRHQTKLVTRLCSNGTLFNEQFEKCEHYFKVKCPIPETNLTD